MCCAVVQFPHNLFATKRAVVHFIKCSKNKLIKGDHHVWHWPTFLVIILLRLLPLSTSCAWQLCAPTDCSLSTNVYKTHKLCSRLWLKKIISLTSSLSAWTLIMCCAVVQFPHNLFATKRAVVHFITCSKNKLIKGDHHVWHWPTFVVIILLRLLPLSTSCAWRLCAPTDCSLSTNVYKTHKLCSHKAFWHDVSFFGQQQCCLGLAAWSVRCA